jgi:hypothetical protein
MGQKKVDTMGHTKKYYKPRNFYYNEMRYADDGAEKNRTRWWTKNLRGIPPFKYKETGAHDEPLLKIISAHDREEKIAWTINFAH